MSAEAGPYAIDDDSNPQGASWSDTGPSTGMHPLVQRIRWANVARSLGVLALLGAVVAWPLTRPDQPPLPAPAALRPAAPAALPASLAAPFARRQRPAGRDQADGRPATSPKRAPKAPAAAVAAKHAPSAARSARRARRTKGSHASTASRPRAVASRPHKRRPSASARGRRKRVVHAPTPTRTAAPSAPAAPSPPPPAVRPAPSPPPPAIAAPPAAPPREGGPSEFVFG
jgi:hypothetical protein